MVRRSAMVDLFDLGLLLAGIILSSRCSVGAEQIPMDPADRRVFSPRGFQFLNPARRVAFSGESFTRHHVSGSTFWIELNRLLGKRKSAVKFPGCNQLLSET